MKSSLYVLLSLHAFCAFAENARPSDDDLFGSSEAATATPTVKEENVDARDDLEPSDVNRDAFASGIVKENPLQIGGSYYQELDISWQEKTAAKDLPMSFPLIFDGFLDSRPNDRLRGFIDWRLTYDAGLDEYSRSENSSAGSFMAPGQTLERNNPSLHLNQAWLKFDVSRRVFMTVGKQHVKWGTGQYWNPTDFLSPQKKDPFAAVDSRLGVSMIKANIPLEAYAANVYAILALDQGGPADRLGKVASFLRYEQVVSFAEVGFDVITRLGQEPGYGVDVSLPLGPLDFYLEVAYLKSTKPRYEVVGDMSAGVEVNSLFRASQETKALPSTTTGANYTFGWQENRRATVGVEYFHNPHGYKDAKVYPVLIFMGNYQPFYLGQDYAAFYLNAEGPDAQKKTSYRFTSLANLSDKSGLLRLDFNWQALTDLRFNAFLASHQGSKGSEFNFAIDTPELASNGQTFGPIHVPATSVNLGVGLALSF